MSKHWREISHSMNLLTPSSPAGHPTLSLTTNSSWLPWGGLPCLSSALWCQYPKGVSWIMDTVQWTSVNNFETLSHTGIQFYATKFQLFTTDMQNFSLIQQYYFVYGVAVSIIPSISLLVSQQSHLRWYSALIHTCSNCQVECNGAIKQRPQEVCMGVTVHRPELCNVCIRQLWHQRKEAIKQIHTWNYTPYCLFIYHFCQEDLTCIIVLLTTSAKKITQSSRSVCFWESNSGAYN